MSSRGSMRPAESGVSNGSGTLLGIQRSTRRERLGIPEQLVDEALGALLVRRILGLSRLIEAGLDVSHREVRRDSKASAAVNPPAISVYYHQGQSLGEFAGIGRAPNEKITWRSCAKALRPPHGPADTLMMPTGFLRYSGSK